MADRGGVSLIVACAIAVAVALLFAGAEVNAQSQEDLPPCDHVDYEVFPCAEWSQRTYEYGEAYDDGGPDNQGNTHCGNEHGCIYGYVARVLHSAPAPQGTPVYAIDEDGNRVLIGRAAPPVRSASGPFCVQHRPVLYDGDTAARHNHAWPCIDGEQNTPASWPDHPAFDQYNRIGGNNWISPGAIVLRLSPGNRANDVRLYTPLAGERQCNAGNGQFTNYLGGTSCFGGLYDLTTSAGELKSWTIDGTTYKLSGRIHQYNQNGTVVFEVCSSGSCPAPDLEISSVSFSTTTPRATGVLRDEDGNVIGVNQSWFTLTATVRNTGDGPTLNSTEVRVYRYPSGQTWIRRFVGGETVLPLDRGSSARATIDLIAPESKGFFIYFACLGDRSAGNCSKNFTVTVGDPLPVSRTQAVGSQSTFGSQAVGSQSTFGSQATGVNFGAGATSTDACSDPNIRSYANLQIHHGGTGALPPAIEAARDACVTQMQANGN